MRTFQFFCILFLLGSLSVFSQETKDIKITELKEESPFFRECKRSKKRNKDCFEKQFLKHFKRRFNAELPYKLDLKSGKKTIYISFTINLKGKLDDIKVYAPHKKIELEVIRVLKKFPKLFPGVQNGAEVPVKYSTTIFLFVGESKTEKRERKATEKRERKSKN